jgi:phage baseplate assembly protein gpV
MRTTDLHQRYHGIYLGKVVAVDDPSGLGRVRLETDQLADTSDDPVWATVSRPLGGDGPTVFFTPEKNDQVIVAYMQGDPRQPVVLGYAHHRGRTPSRVGPNTHAIVTDAGRITFDDNQRSITVEVGATKIVLSAGGIAINAAAFTINGQPVVLGAFLGAFNTHVHATGPGVPPVPAPPVTGGPPITTGS